MRNKKTGGHDDDICALCEFLGAGGAGGGGGGCGGIFIFITTVFFCIISFINFPI